MVKQHRKSVGESDEWFTPSEIFDGLNCRFDLDPCQPDEGRAFLSVPCDRFLTASMDGLTAPWDGFVWMNPPFGKRNGVVPWLRRFFDHGNGIALVFARTSAGWFHEWAPKADVMLFPKGKTKFVRPDGSIGNSPGDGAVLFAAGKKATQILCASPLGITVRITP